MAAEALVVFSHSQVIDDELALRLAHMYGQPPINAMGRTVSDDKLRKWWADARRNGSGIGVPINPPGIRPRGGGWEIALTGLEAAALSYDTDAFLEFDVLKRADPPLATVYAADDRVDLAVAGEADLYYSILKRIPPILEAEYAIGGDVHDFVDPELQKPLDKPWTVLYFNAARLAKLDLASLPPATRVDPQPDGGAWMLTGANPFVDFAGKDAALAALGKALGFPLGS